MSDIEETRRKNLRRIVNEHEGMNTLGRKLGYARGAFISQMLTDPPTRPFSEKTARKFERKLRLQEGFFDKPPTPMGSVAAPLQALNPAVLTAALGAVFDALKAAKVTPSTAQMADVVMMAYMDGLPTGQVNAEFVQRAVNLLKR